MIPSYLDEDAISPGDRPKTALYDLDGTLVDVSGILHYVLQRPKRYDDFYYAAATVCPRNENVYRSMIDDYNAGLEIVILTGRPEKFRELTEGWIKTKLMPAPIAALFMRSDGSHAPAAQYKKTQFMGSIHQTFDVVKAYDDNPKCCEMFRGLDIPEVIEIKRGSGR